MPLNLLIWANDGAGIDFRRQNLASVAYSARIDFRRQTSVYVRF